MKKLRVLVVTADGLIPPEGADTHPEINTASWKMEYDVMTALGELGHEATIIEVYDDLGRIRKNIESFKPDIVFNLVHEFHGVGVYDHHIAAYLELLKQPYTGCNPRGLLLSHDKVLAKKLMLYHRIATPRFQNYPLGKKFQKPSKLDFPLLVKSTSEDASLGISQASVVHTVEKLKERVEYIHEQIKTDALVEEYIEGRELFLGIMGNTRLTTFNPWEIVFSNIPDNSYPIFTNRAKWDESYREKHQIKSKVANKLPEEVERQLAPFAKKIYRTLFLSGYARLDCRLRDDGKLFCLEANANCDLSIDDEFSCAGRKSGFTYNQIIQKILTFGLQYDAAWKQA